MIPVDKFAGQNWLIAPAGRAVGEPVPTKIAEEKWQLTLSGVIIPNFEGNSGNDWRRETLQFTPDYQKPLMHAVSRYSIPKPEGEEGTNYLVKMKLEQWCPFAAPSSMFNQGQSVNSGFAVDVWRPNQFGHSTDFFSGAPVNNLFGGIQVDVAVRDTDAVLHRVSYHITLLGQIVFIPIGF